MGEKGPCRTAAGVNGPSSPSCRRLWAAAAVPQGGQVHTSPGSSDTGAVLTLISAPLDATALTKGSAYRSQVVGGTLV